MNQISASPWSPMVSGPEEEFANFLEFGDLQLTFPSFEGPMPDGGDLRQEAGSAMDIPMGNRGEVLGLDEEHMPEEMNQNDPMRFMDGFQGSTESFHEMNMRAELFHPLQQQQSHTHSAHYRSQNIIPPTPNSIELHGEHTRYYRSSGEHQSQAVFERFGRNQKDQVRS